ncbi:MAG: hypothetical protein M1820_000567 [Bogoriella megaspora]|nr:MAG: hypothetical protein M1820_000567 [Bogoriella megaspora]
MYIASSLLLLFTTWSAWTCVNLFKNYRIARKINLPIIVSPTGTLNPLWIITYKLIPSIIPLLDLLPLKVGRWARYTYMGWQFDDKHAIHDELGPAFVLCTPSLNEVIVADSSAVHSILSRRKDFIKPAIMYDGLNAFGKNLDSVEGETWQKHRKLTAPNFNERVSSSVWSESLRQASQMLHEWISSPEGTLDMVRDTATLALHVLTYAGLGIQYTFKDANNKLEAPHSMTYRDALSLALSNFTLLVMLPMNAMTLPLFPAKVRKVGQACLEFKLYMKEMVDGVKSSPAKNQDIEAHNLLGALVQASQAENHGLSDDELYGNLFIYNMAGHESTANTVATSVAYLAAAPKWQDWIFKELREVLEYSSSTRSWIYEEVYPRLKRCQAIQLETLRLHGSTVFLPKATGNATQIVTIAGTDIAIPPNTFVVANSQALHCDTRSWGDDALEWRPDRWILQRGIPGEEELIEPQPGTFIGWAGGPRVCPGKKFSQVEFAAVMAALFREHKVAPRAEGNETAQETRKRLERMIEDSTITAITLQMKNPRDVRLVWSKRS